MFCNQCGNECKLGEKFCSKCGADLEATEIVTDNQVQMSVQTQTLIQRQDSIQMHAPTQSDGNQMIQSAYQGIVQQEGGNGKKKSSKGLVIGLTIAVVILVVGVAGVILFFKEGNSIKKQLKMADRYLAELDYDEAIKVFQSILDIDPKCVDAYAGLANAYVGLEEYDSAIAILEEGIARTDNGELKELLEEIKIEKEAMHRDSQSEMDVEEKIRQEEELDEVPIEIQEALERIAGYCADENYYAVFEYMSSEEFSEILQIVRDMELETPYIKDIPQSGKKVGLYEMVSSDNDGNNYNMIYYGDYKDSIREGEGDWLGCTKNEGTYHAKGTWENDVPNGYQEVRWTISYPASEEKDEYDLFKGEVINGLWNGPVELVIGVGNGEEWMFPLMFQNGIYEVLGIFDADDIDETCYEISEGLVTHEVVSTRGIMGFAQCHTT